jgi:hypothetical protein
VPPEGNLFVLVIPFYYILEGRPFPVGLRPLSSCLHNVSALPVICFPEPCALAAYGLWLLQAVIMKARQSGMRPCNNPINQLPTLTIRDTIFCAARANSGSQCIAQESYERPTIADVDLFSALNACLRACYTCKYRAIQAYNYDAMR